MKNKYDKNDNITCGNQKTSYTNSSLQKLVRSRTSEVPEPQDKKGAKGNLQAGLRLLLIGLIGIGFAFFVFVNNSHPAKTMAIDQTEVQRFGDALDKQDGKECAAAFLLLLFAMVAVRDGIARLLGFDEIEQMSSAGLNNNHAKYSPCAFFPPYIPGMLGAVTNETINEEQPETADNSVRYNPDELFPDVTGYLNEMTKGNDNKMITEH